MGLDRIVVICNAFQHYVAINRSANGELRIDATTEVNGERRDLPWLMGQLWTCKDAMPAELCLHLRLPDGSSYSRAARFLSQQQRQRDRVASLPGPAVMGLSPQERQGLIKQLKQLTLRTPDHV